MDLENTNGPMETCIKVNFVKIWDKVKEKWYGMMEALTLGNGKEDYLMAKVPIVIFKLGIFKVKGEKPRAGYFEDNVLVNESRLHSKSKKSGEFR